MFNPEQVLAESLITQAAQAIFDTVGSFATFAANRAKDHATRRKTSRAYAEYFMRRHGTVKVLDMAQPVSLGAIYTSVKVIDPKYLSDYTRIEEMERQFVRSGRRHHSNEGKTPSVSGLSIANDSQFLNVLGAPGSGKTTFLRRLGHDALGLDNSTKRPRYNHKKLPILIELKDLRKGKVDLIQAMETELLNGGFPDPNSFLQKALDSGSLLILLDGLDEVPDSRLNTVINRVSELSSKYGTESSPNRFVTSCRTAQYKSFFRNFKDVVLADFDKKQVAEFAIGWFGKDARDTANRFIKRIMEPQNAPSLELARTPLLLTFLCIVFQHGQEFPPTRATLYRRALDILLREWSAARLVHTKPIADFMHAELELDMLGEIAHDFFKASRFFFSREEAKDRIKRFISKEHAAPRSVDADDILSAIEIQQGLIVRRAGDAYSFSHLTIQEYLTGKYLIDNDLWEESVDAHLFESRWAVVYELMAGMRRADFLLKYMAAIAHRRLLQSAEVNCRFSRFIKCLGKYSATGGTPEKKAAARLCVAGALLCLVLAATEDTGTLAKASGLLISTVGLVPNIDNESGGDALNTIQAASVVGKRRAAPKAVYSELFRDLTVLLKRGKYSPPERLRELVDCIRSDGTLRINTASLRSALDLDEDSLSHIEAHLDVYILMLRCQRAAYGFTSSCWSDACDTFFKL
jgi:hypothetical protein